MDQKLNDAIQIAANAVNEAEAALSELENDVTTDPGKLATKRTAAKETLAILRERHAKAREIAAAAAAGERARQIAVFRSEATELRRKADHARKSAEGQVDGIYGVGTAEFLRYNNRNPLNAAALETEAVNTEGQAEQLEVEK